MEFNNGKITNHPSSPERKDKRLDIKYMYFKINELTNLLAVKFNKKYDKLYRDSKPFFQHKIYFSSQGSIKSSERINISQYQRKLQYAGPMNSRTFQKRLIINKYFRCTYKDFVSGENLKISPTVTLTAAVDRETG